MRTKFFLACLCSSLLFNCEEGQDYKNLDPYQMTFWGKGIKYMISSDESGILDTTIFDNSGNIIEIRKSSSVEKREYDANHFMTRLFYDGDVVFNFRIEYQFQKDYMDQIWVPYKNSNWAINDSLAEIDSSKIYVMRFRKLDGNFESISDTKDFQVLFSFNEENRLISKKEISLVNGNELRSYAYHYNDKLELSLVKFYENRIHISDCFLTNGLPDSLVYSNRRDLVIRFKYVKN